MFINSTTPLYDIELLRSLRGCRISRSLKVLCVIGSHRFDELPLINQLFPKLEHIYLFEPQPAQLQALNMLAENDSRIRVFPVAISDQDGTALFNVSSNDGESSSLLRLGTHQELFPEVTMTSTIEVQARRLDSVLAEQGLVLPDVMIMDVQGAEYRIIKSFSAEILDALRLIYSEVSLEPVYESAGLLSDVESLLAPRFRTVRFAPINPWVSVHGNAVFVAHSEVSSALELSARERLRRVIRKARGLKIF